MAQNKMVLGSNRSVKISHTLFYEARPKGYLANFVPPVLEDQEGRKFGEVGSGK